MAKILISISDELLDRVDREAGAQRRSRSQFFQEAARRQLGWSSPNELDAALRRGRVALAHARAFKSAEVIREDRVARDADDRRR